MTDLSPASVAAGYQASILVALRDPRNITGNPVGRVLQVLVREGVDPEQHRRRLALVRAEWPDLADALVNVLIDHGLPAPAEWNAPVDA